MNDILLNIKDLFTRLIEGDFSAFTSGNTVWLAFGAITCVLLLVIRMLTRPKKHAEPANPETVDLELLLRTPGENGVFGPLTDALATQLPERAE